MGQWKESSKQKKESEVHFTLISKFTQPKAQYTLCRDMYGRRGEKELIMADKYYFVAERERGGSKKGN